MEYNNFLKRQEELYRFKNCKACFTKVNFCVCCIELHECITYNFKLKNREEALFNLLDKKLISRDYFNIKFAEIHSRILIEL